MCWSSRNKKLIECYKVAEKDIPVRKVMSKYIDVPDKYFSYFKGFEYESGKAYTMSTETFDYLKRYTFHDWVSITKGFHSYDVDCKYECVKVKMKNNTFLPVRVCTFNVYSPDKFKHLEYYAFNQCPIIIDCVIPKGTPYYVNDCGEYVSLSIKIIGETDITAAGIDIPELNNRQ